MKSIVFVILLNYLYSQFFIQYGSTEPNEYPLMLVLQDADLELAWPTIPPQGHSLDYLAIGIKLLYLCPTEPKPALKIVQQIGNRSYGPVEKICDEPVEPTILKVKRAFYDEYQEKPVHLYHIGFLINDERLKNVEMYSEYESLNKDHKFITSIWIYRDTESQYTIAASYDITQVDVQKKMENEKILAYQHSDLFADKFETLYKDQKSKLKEILKEDYVEDQHTLVLDSLVNENNFLIDMWKKTTYFKVFQIPIWKKNIDNWRNIQEFLRNVSHNYISSIQGITIGIGKALTIKGSEGKKYEMKWGEGENTVSIPELYWAAIELVEEGEISGMLVIMHNDPNAEDNNVEKICDKNFCLDSKFWQPTVAYEPLKNRVYCCPMDAVTINKLEVTYFLKSRNPIDGIHPVTFPPTWP